MPHDLYIEINHEEVLVLNDSEEEGDVEQKNDVQEVFEATPVYCYRRYLTGTTQVEIGFDPDKVDKVHVVFVKYSQKDQEQWVPRWAIAEIVPSRRCAKGIATEIDEGEWPHDGPWLRENCVIDSVEIYSLEIED